MGYLHSLPVLSCNHREFHIRIVEHGKYLAGSLGSVIGLGQQFLHFPGKGMLPFVQHHFKRTLKMADPIVRLHVCVQRFLWNGKDFRHDIGGMLRGPVGQGLGP